MVEKDWNASSRSFQPPVSTRRHLVHALFLRQVYFGNTFRPFLSVPARSMKDFSVFFALEVNLHLSGCVVLGTQNGPLTVVRNATFLIT